MKTEQYLLTGRDDWNSQEEAKLGDSAQLVMIFGNGDALQNGDAIRRIARLYPKALLFGCSTAGEICGPSVYDNACTATAVAFEDTTVKAAKITVADAGNSYEVGKELAGLFPAEDLRHVIVLSEGLQINGSQLVRGLSGGLPAGVTVTGGLSGDSDRFKETYVLCGEYAERHIVAALGFYGTRLKVGYGSFGGWDPFGPERLVTHSKENILYELDGKSALKLYTTYLGAQAIHLPASGLLFPLSVRTSTGAAPVVRTLLSINENDQGMVFAGDMPEGSYARLMKANFDRLIDGAMEAAKITGKTLGPYRPELAVLISCVGRKLILKQRVEEEIESVQEVLGQQAALTGFYSYGEISPFVKDGTCELHNQTMTVTAFTESE
ncbi:MAG: FIST C-terminal domain-containing protein [Deltaproteobacteria bacterium]|nr:FIST C-terminal domain-containing protein [Deltaproteobacteria bacterium]